MNAIVRRPCQIWSSAPRTAAPELLFEPAPPQRVQKRNGVVGVLSGYMVTQAGRRMWAVIHTEPTFAAIGDFTVLEAQDGR
jgi:hypothetical protein